MPAIRSAEVFMLSLLVSLVILAMVFGVIWWILDQLPIPAPFNMIIRVILGLILILALLGLIGIGPGIGLGVVSLR
jgi:heme A synthase